MSLQQPGPGESFATNLALVAEVVCEDVHGEGRHANVHLDIQAHEVSWHKVHRSIESPYLVTDRALLGIG